MCTYAQAMLEGVKFPWSKLIIHATRLGSALTTGVTDLNTSLTYMKRDNFTHCEIKIDDYKAWMTSEEETWNGQGQGLWQQILLFLF